MFDAFMSSAVEQINRQQVGDDDELLDRYLATALGVPPVEGSLRVPGAAGPRLRCRLVLEEDAEDGGCASSGGLCADKADEAELPPWRARPSRAAPPAPPMPPLEAPPPAHAAGASCTSRPAAPKARTLADAAAPGGGTFALVAAAANLLPPSGEVEAHLRSQARDRARARAAARVREGAEDSQQRRPQVDKQEKALVHRPKPSLATRLAVKCEISEDDGDDEPPEEVKIWTIFIDELPMPGRPNVEPDKLDREVFARWLPNDIRCEEELLTWLQDDFGAVESVFLLKEDDTGELKGSAYIRFSTHTAAELYVDAEGDAAAWSEAERAAKRSGSVYGADVHSVFVEPDGRASRSVLARCGVPQLWVQGESQKPQGPVGLLPAAVSSQLHFSVACSRRQLEGAKAALGDVLLEFHDSVCRRPPPPSARWLGGASPVPVSRKQRLLARLRSPRRRPDCTDDGSPPAKRSAKDEPMEVPKGKNLVWDSATGLYMEEDLPDDVQELIFLGSTGPLRSGARGVKQEIGAEPGGGGHSWAARVKWETNGVAEPVGALPVEAPSCAGGSSSSRTPEDWHRSTHTGERLVAEGRAAAARGHHMEAVAKYREGLQVLLESMPEGFESEDGLAQRERINQYLTEAERLQAMVETGEEGPILQRRVDECEDIFRDAYDLEKWGFPDRAREKLRGGVRYFLEAVRLLGARSCNPEMLEAKVRALAQCSNLGRELERAGVTDVALREAICSTRNGAGGQPISGPTALMRPAPRVVPPRGQVSFPLASAAPAQLQQATLPPVYVAFPPRALGLGEQVVPRPQGPTQAPAWQPPPQPTFLGQSAPGSQAWDTVDAWEPPGLQAAGHVAPPQNGTWHAAPQHQVFPGPGVPAVQDWQALQAMQAHQHYQAQQAQAHYAAQLMQAQVLQQQQIQMHHHIQQQQMQQQVWRAAYGQRPGVLL